MNRSRSEPTRKAHLPAQSPGHALRWVVILLLVLARLGASSARAEDPPSVSPVPEGQPGALSAQPEASQTPAEAGKLADPADHTPPARVKVLPVFFVPRGQMTPSTEQIETVMQHVWRAQARYGELLGGDTFTVADEGPNVYASSHPVSFYRDLPTGSASQFVGEMLADLRYNRYNCPYVFLVLISNDDPTFSRCGARPLNGGHNDGGGIVEITCNFALPDGFQKEHPAGLQNTVQHELGHGFGLVHPDAYGYGLMTSDSHMSYNPALYTDGFVPRQRAGELIPEDRRALAENKRVFAEYRFDPAKDVPAGYVLKDAVTFPPMDLPGQGVIAGQDKGPVVDAKIPLLVKVRLEHDGEQTGAQDAWVGSQGKRQAMLGFSVTMPEKIPGVELQYQASIWTVDGDTHWADAGVSLSKAELERVATSADQPAAGEHSPVAGFAFRLTGEASEHYDVWYRGHFTNAGDSEWCKNGEHCGTRDPYQVLEALAVSIVPR